MGSRPRAVPPLLWAVALASDVALASAPVKGIAPPLRLRGGASVAVGGRRSQEMDRMAANFPGKGKADSSANIFSDAPSETAKKYSHLAMDTVEDDVGCCGASIFSMIFSSRSAKIRSLNIELWSAARKGDTEACKTLVQMGAQVDAQSPDESSNPRLAFKHLYGFDHIEEREKALNLGIDPKAPKKPTSDPPKREGSGRTALRWAAWSGHAETVEALVLMGSNVNATDPEGWAALHEAAMYGHLEVAQVLLKAEADVNQDTGEQWRPMHLAATFGRLEVAQLLHANGADMCHTTDGGLTAMDWAKAYGHKETAEFLRDAPGARSGGCKTCGRSNFFVQGGIQSVISTM